MDYEKSAFENMEYDRNGFHFARSSVRRRGVFLSRVFDSREKEMEWHRLVLDVKEGDGSPYKIQIYASEEPRIKWENELEETELSIQEFIVWKEVSMEDKLERLKPFCQLEVTGKADLLLHEVKGRYLWFSIEAYQLQGRNIEFREITAYFPKQSWISYLPEIYESSDKEHFLERYLSIFQSIYDDMNARIKQVPYLLDVKTTDPEYLDYLSQWVGVVNSQMWTEQKKRILLSKAAHLFKIRGTRQGILEVIQLYLETEEVFLVEKYKWERRNLSVEKRQLYESLYGQSSYTITILVKEDNVPSKKEYQSLLQVLYHVIPAQADVKLVVLKPYIFLDRHSYLGVNSTLGSYQPASLDGKSVLSFSLIGGENQKERSKHEKYENVSV